MKNGFLGKVICTLFLFCIPSPAFAWNEHGHRVIASMAFQRLDPELRLSIAKKIRKHPRWGQDFASKIPKGVKEGDEQTQAEWIFQQACVWPLITKDFRGEDRQYNHANWHWAFKALYLNDTDQEALGEIGLNQRTRPPAKATEGMNAIQTIEFAKLKISGQMDASDEEIALMYCWLLHSYSDMHQPCHATALFSEKRFPMGDQGANLIKTKKNGTLHQVWDDLLGNENDFRTCQNEARRRNNDAMNTTPEGYIYSFQSDSKSTWERSFLIAKLHVYTEEILNHLRRTESENGERQPLDLTDAYHKRAASVATIQAAQAGITLAEEIRNLKREF